jgi:hypothetical protein
MTIYHLYNLKTENTWPLSAKTDLGARRQAKQYLKDEKDAQDWILMFYRSSDGTEAQIEI